MVRRLLTGAKKTVCLSPVLYRDVAPWVPDDKVEFIANTLAEVPVSFKPLVEDRKRFLFLSNLIPDKGAETFVELAINLSKVRSDVVFDIVGAPISADQLTAFQDKITDSGCVANVNLHGPKYGKDKWEFLEKADALVFPSKLIEAQPLTIIEAFAAGTPVIAYANGGIVDMIENDKNGILIPSGNEQAIQDECIRLLDEPDWFEAAGRNARASYERIYRSDHFTVSWLVILNPNLQDSESFEEDKIGRGNGIAS